MALRALLQARGGGATIADLPFASLTAARRRNDSADTTVTVPTGGVDAATARALAAIVPWRDEISVWDDTDPAEALFTGPIHTPPTYTRAAVTITAKDLFAWFDHRLLPEDRHYRDDDLGFIFTGHAADALRADPSPAVTVTPTSVGIRGDRDVLAANRLNAGDAMRELMRSGVDFTMVGRALLLSSEQVTAVRLPPLIDDAALDPQAGGSTTSVPVASEVTVLGATGEDRVQVVGMARAPDAPGGLLQTVRSEPAIRDNTSARHAAQTTLAGALATSLPFTTGLAAGWAPLRQLVPGRVTRAALRVGVRDVIGDYRLVSVTYTAAAGGVVGVSATFVPVAEV